MYLNFYGLREEPFGVTPDPRHLYLGPAHREALASLEYGIQTGRGFLTLVAPPGMGKTTLLFHLLQKYSASARTAFLFQTQCDSREFLRYLFLELGLDVHDTDFVRLHDQFNQLLVRESRAGKRFIVVVDEAQNLAPSVLETVRLLSDFETSRAKLLQIILSGQPELADKLASPGLSQLRQRVSAVIRLQPFTQDEVAEYIIHRLSIAGYRGGQLFTHAALKAIAEYSEGIPRLVNQICFSSLSMGYALGRKLIDAAIVGEVIRDLDFDWAGNAPRSYTVGETPEVVDLEPQTPGPSSEMAEGQDTKEEVDVQNTELEFAAVPSPEMEFADPVASYFQTSSPPEARGPESRTIDRRQLVVEQAAVATAATAGDGGLDLDSLVRDYVSLHSRPERRRPLDLADYTPANCIAEKVQVSDAAAQSKSMTGVSLAPTTSRHVGSSTIVKSSLRRWLESPLGLAGLATVLVLVVLLIYQIRPATARSASRIAIIGAAGNAAAAKESNAPVQSVGTGQRTGPNITERGTPKAEERSASEAESVTGAEGNRQNITVSAGDGRQNNAAKPESSVSNPNLSHSPVEELVYKVSPVYPPAAKLGWVQGMVVITAVIGSDGSVRHLRVVSGPPLLAQAALAAVKQWRFKPHRGDDKGVEEPVQIAVNFRLQPGPPGSDKVSRDVGSEQMQSQDQ